ncbi:MAG: GatB/YqeY domain-containing protein [Bacilli bacterium]
MNLTEIINNDLKDSMKNADRFSLSVLRMLKSALQLEQISKKHELADDEVLSVIKKQVKVRKDSVEEYKNYSKMDEVKSLENEIELLSKYLPAEMSEEEINKIINETFEELNPTSIKDMGNIMKSLTAKITNADMSLVSKIVREKLN